MILLSNIIEALRAIRANLQRTLLTMLIIAFGLTALVGVLTSIDGIKYWFSNSFVRLGANTFRIENYTTQLRSGGGPISRGKVHSPISYAQAKAFKEAFSGYSPVSAVGLGNLSATGKFKNRSTQANLQLMGSDESFVLTDNYRIDKGRNLNAFDLKNARNVIVLGHEAVTLLFPDRNPVEKMVYLDGKAYRVIGTFAEIGNSGLVGGDKMCIIPATTLIKDLPDNFRSFSLHVLAPTPEEMDNYVFEAVGMLRQVRGLKPKEENDFGIVRSEQIINNFMENLRYLTWSATVISIITLFSAAIGLMNIMLVSVTERTREIGVRKATGATRNHILSQFLTEAIIITQLGGVLGILLGVLAGNLVGLLLGGSFAVPWDWVFGGFLLCLIVGVLAGIYPARKAARLDPIESLRYE
ncbi:MAG: ABC transporter permease [Bacteroidota bacterium]